MLWPGRDTRPSREEALNPMWDVQNAKKAWGAMETYKGGTGLVWGVQGEFSCRRDV